MKKGELYDMLSKDMTIKFPDGEYANYEDGEFYINKSFFTADEAAKLVEWINSVNKEVSSER